MTVPTHWAGELQFRRYSDTSSQGPHGTFAFPDREALEAFIGEEGQRFAVVFVKLGADDRPIVESKPERTKPGPLCREAIDLCARSDFWQWLRVSGLACQSESDAKECVLAMCDVGSRKDLDAVATAGEKFVVLVRVPFMKWLRNRGKT